VSKVPWRVDRCSCTLIQSPFHILLGACAFCTLIIFFIVSRKLYTSLVKKTRTVRRISHILIAHLPLPQNSTSVNRFNNSTIASTHKFMVGRVLESRTSRTLFVLMVWTLDSPDAMFACYILFELYLYQLDCGCRCPTYVSTPSQTWCTKKCMQVQNGKKRKKKNLSVSPRTAGVMFSCTLDIRSVNI
jgi:hypothetical protein